MNGFLRTVVAGKWPSEKARFGRRTSIRTRLVLLVTVSIALSLMVGTAISLVQETTRYLEAKREALLATALVFARVTADPLATGDDAGVMRAIAGMRDLAKVDYVAVEDGRGRLVAEIGVTARLVGDASFGGEADGGSLWSLLSSRSVELSAPIGHESAGPVGRLTVVADASDLAVRLAGSLALTVAGSAASLVLGLAAAFRMQRAISGPVRDLARTMGTVRDQHDYTIVAKAASNDEVGDLVASFNAMLEEIRTRDGRLARHRETLEQEVSDRTREMRSAKLSAEAANAAKSEFLAMMSHEIRTPMNGLLVMAELLAAAELPDRQRRYAEVILRSGQSLLAIINDILDLSKVEAGKMELEEIAVDPAELADTVLNLFWERAQAKGLDLAAQVAPDIPGTILGDPVRLNQVVGNLVNNAIKFTESGHVLVSLDRDPLDPQRIRFTVSDTGIGIPASKIDALFDAFSQVDRSTSRRYGGTGLGLAICKRLVEEMGGAIRVTSSEGRGSSFAFSLPMRGAVAGRDLPRVEAGQRLLAIVAIDGDATSRVAADRLAQAGWRVERRSPAELAEGLPAADLLIVEGRALAALGGIERRGGPVVVALTMMGDGSERTLQALGSADAILVRPLSPREFEQVVSRVSAGLAPATRSSAPAQPAGGRRFAGARVLVADDSAVNREVAVEALARLGVHAAVANDGREAVAAVEARAFDLVFMDGSMPELDGFEATLRLRAREERLGLPRLPIVALTAHVVGSASERWREAGMDGVLHKPFTLAALEECLRRWLPASSVETDAAAPGPAAPVPVAASESGPPVLDHAVIGQMTELAAADGGAFLERVVGLYRSHAPAALDRLAEATGQSEAGLALQAEAAHALKSMSQNVGAARVAACAARMEHSARVEGRALTSADIEEARAAMAETVAALAALVDQAALEASSAKVA
jgi:signal transduction histidine kinase/CheY-like chemotaxis protein/HPt (histidine-containing phosphotransfer) domain-containing protein